MYPMEYFTNKETYENKWVPLPKAAFIIQWWYLRGGAALMWGWMLSKFLGKVAVCVHTYLRGSLPPGGWAPDWNMSIVFQTGLQQNVKRQRRLRNKPSRNTGVYSPRMARVPTGQAKGAGRTPSTPVCLSSAGLRGLASQPRLQWQGGLYTEAYCKSHCSL